MSRDLPSVEPEAAEESRWDAVVIGSGFGGAMAAHRLVEAGARVLMIERGGWVERGAAAWLPEATLELSPHYCTDTPYRCEAGGYSREIGGYSCVGGPSVFYGGVAFRFRERDFDGDPEIIADSGAGWPLRYDELEPHYTEAERLLGVAGDDRADPTAPWRSAPYPQAPAPLAAISRRIAAAAGERALSPFRLPLAINYGDSGRQRCVACRTCDTFACAIGAKNDIETVLIRPLIARGMTLWPRHVAVRLQVDGRQVRRLEVVGRDSRRRRTVEASLFVLAAGALGTPHLLLASRLDRLSPAPGAIGRFLTRHCNAMVFGVFAGRADREQVFHKQLAIHDWYFGDPADGDAPGKLGGLQQVMTPPRSLVQAHLPPGLRAPLGLFTENLTGLLCIAEDQPRAANGVRVDWDTIDGCGMPQLVIEHRYSRRDLQARRALVRRAKQVLRGAGAWFFHTHGIRTFSHALGTVRTGTDPDTAPIDPHGRFRGLDNLFVVDGSVLPTSAGVNPSLTIAAFALRAAGSMVHG